MMRKVLAVSLASVLFAPATTALAQERVKDAGSFTAKGIPYADYTYSYPTTGTYWTCVDGQEGVHKTTFEYKAPDAGTFTASMVDFTGDWDVALLDDQGEMVGFNGKNQWIDHDGNEQVATRVERGDKIYVVGCNWSSLQTEVEVTYELSSNDATPAPPRLAHLASAKKARLRERVPINFVFVGFDRDRIKVPEFLQALPARYKPIVRSRALSHGFYDYIGIDYAYDYDVAFSSARYEDRFFRKLGKLSQRGVPTAYQKAYNRQAKKRLEIKNNFYVDAPSVEGWLAKNPPGGIDTTENTIFFLNWHGREDFRFHVYTKQGERNPDSDFDFGKWESQMTSAWGGTTPDDEQSGLGSLHRVWFYDFSAGPDRLGRNYIVDRKDLDRDGREDYRIPPIWEYSSEGYRKPEELTGDTAKLARYVGINLLFTPSPLYDPAVNAPRLPRQINLDLNVYEGAAGIDASEEWLEPEVVRRELAELLALNDVTVDLQDLSVADGKFLSCYTLWYWVYHGPSCYEDKPYSVWANPFVHHAATLAATRDGPKEADYEAGGFNYALDAMGWAGGYADDNYWDGTQSFVHNFMTRSVSPYIGFTSFAIHEYGHHFGASHPHDGFDYERGRNYGYWNDEFAFSFVGTASNSVMNYLDVNNDFSQFDRDNMNRWHAAAYIESAKAIVKRLLKHERRGRVGDELARADDIAGKARRAFSDHAYLAAASLAQKAYDVVLEAANEIGIEIVGNQSGTTVRDKGDGSGEGLHRLRHLHPAAFDPLSARPAFDDLKRLVPAIEQQGLPPGRSR